MWSEIRPPPPQHIILWQIDNWGKCNCLESKTDKIMVIIGELVINLTTKIITLLEFFKVFVQFFCDFLEVFLNAHAHYCDWSLYAVIVYEHYCLCPGWHCARSSQCTLCAVNVGLWNSMAMYVTKPLSTRPRLQLSFGWARTLQPQDIAVIIVYLRSYCHLVNYYWTTFVSPR
jgi:hypothetical protein